MRPARRYAAVIALLGLGPLAAVSACSNSGSPNAAGPSTTPDASATETGADAALIDAGLLQPPGCFQGTPTAPLEILNACTSSAFVVFDNCTRVGYCDGGTLPERVVPPTPDAGNLVDASADASGE